MPTSRFTLALTVLVTALPLQFALAAGKGDDWVAKADRFRSPQGAFSVSVNVTDIQGEDKKQSSFRVSSKDKSLTLVEQTAPSRQQGRKLLMRDRDLWLYSPNVSRPTRISFEQKLTGEVSNGDLMRTNFADDYDANSVSDETLDGIATVKLHLTAKTKEVTYRTIDYWVSKSNAQPVKAVFFALSGKPLKTALYSGFKKQLGQVRLTKVEITDALQKNRKSILNYGAFKKEKFDDSYFSKESLGQ